MESSVIFIGIRGNVVCLDRATGNEVWSSALKGTDFVTLLLDGDRLFAASRGEVYCLDVATGRHLWNNGMPGQGYGLASIASAAGSSNPTPPAEQHRQDEQKKNQAVSG